MAQQPPLAKDEHSRIQPPPPPPENIQYYPIFYLQPSFPFPMGVNSTAESRPWFVCHPVTPNDPFFPFISDIARPQFQKMPEKQAAPVVKIEDDEEINIENQSIPEKSNTKGKKGQAKKKKAPPTLEEIEKQPCNCTQSNCLKRYCGCFHSGRKCLETCACNSCKNCSEFEDERDQAINHVYRKCHRDKKIPIQELLSLQVSYGCKCKSTGCQKNYCECFKREQACGKFCSCENCINITGNEEGEKKKKVQIQK